jgi:hypothetical protein
VVDVKIGPPLGEQGLAQDVIDVVSKLLLFQTPLVFIIAVRTSAKVRRFKLPDDSRHVLRDCGTGTRCYKEPFMVSEMHRLVRRYPSGNLFEALHEHFRNHDNKEKRN